MRQQQQQRRTFLFIFFSIIATIRAQDDNIKCPAAGGTITMAGANGARRVVEAWKDAYTEKCPDIGIVTQGGGYPMGAARVCDNHIAYAGVDLGGMSGPFFYPQATSDNGWKYDCKHSGQEAILIHVASQGINVDTAANSTAAKCIQMLGGGLSLHQLRWIFTSYPESELDHSGWDVTSVPFSDGDESTHLWSELNENCTATEIVLAGPPSGTGAYDFFTTHVLTSLNEAPRAYYSTLDAKDIHNFLQQNDGAISFFQMYEMLSVEYANAAPFIAPVPILDEDGHFVPPNEISYESGEYPLVRKVYLGVKDTADSLAVTRPFLEFGLSLEGSKILKSAGFWPLKDWEKLVMYTRLQSSLGFKTRDIGEHCGEQGGHISIAGSTTVEPVSHMWASIFELGCHVSIELSGGGSSAGAARICGDPEAGKPVDIGNMSRDLEEEEAVEREEEFVHDCVMGDQRRSSFSVDVALDGLTVVVPLNSPGHSCISLLGGLTRDQLRWIYSSYDEAQLTKSGWDSSSLKNSDGDPYTHKWSELDERCEPKEIRLVGGLRGDGPFTALENYILDDVTNGETIARDKDRPLGYFAAEEYDIMMELLKSEASLAFIGHHYFLEKQDLFWAAPLMKTDGSFVAPTAESIGDKTYPIIRRLFMNLLNDKNSLQYTVPLLEFGFNHPGLIVPSGYIPLQGDELDEMFNRIYSAPYLDDEIQVDDDDDFEFSPAVFTGMALGFILLVGTAVFICTRMCAKDTRGKA